MTEIAIDLNGVEVSRSGRTILSIDQLSIPRGSFFGIVGPNGAGKTTLLRIMAALVLPDSGTVNVLGQSVTSLPRWRLPDIRRRVAYVPQSVQFNTSVPLTTTEVVSIGLAGRAGLFRPVGKADLKMVDDWLERLGLADLKRQTISSLSGGELRKALIAKSMVQQPDILLLDEPSANLDIDWKERLSDIVSRIHSETGITVILVSHETGFIPESCNDIALIRRGRILLRAPRETALDPETIRALHGGGGELLPIDEEGGI